MVGALTIRCDDMYMNAVYFGENICNIRTVRDKLIIRLNSEEEVTLKTLSSYEQSPMDMCRRIITRVKEVLRDDGCHTVDFIINPNKEIVYWGIDYDR